MEQRLQVTLVNLFHAFGGAERCVTDLHDGLQRQGHSVQLLVGRTMGARGSSLSQVSVLPRFFPEHIIQRILSRVCGLTDCLMVGPLLNAWAHPSFHQADVVHFHILNGSYFNLWALPILARKTPVVITLHDMWLLTGDCHHSEDCTRWQESCGRCPLFRRPVRLRNGLGLFDFTRFNLAVKRRVFRRIPAHRLTLVSPSQWLASHVRNSHLGRFPLQVVPNGVDLTTFAPGDRKSFRAELKLPADRPLLAAVAGNWNNPHKGGECLLPIAEGLARSGMTRLVVVGQIDAKRAERLRGFGSVVLGSAQPSHILRKVFAACDGLLMLSRSENYPYIVSEALACGCPVIARAVGGIPEMVEHGVQGWLIPPEAGLDEWLHTIRTAAAAAEFTRRASRNHAQRFLALSQMIANYQDVYRQSIARYHLDPISKSAGRAA